MPDAGDDALRALLDPTRAAHQRLRSAMHDRGLSWEDAERFTSEVLAEHEKLIRERVAKEIEAEGARIKAAADRETFEISRALVLREAEGFRFSARIARGEGS